MDTPNNPLNLDLSGLDLAALQKAIPQKESLFKTVMFRNAQDRIVEIWTEVEDDGSEKDGGLRRFYAPINVTLNTPMGQQPLALHVPLDAANLREAFDQYETQVPAKADAAVKKEVERLKVMIREQQRQQAGGLVLPGRG
jgi:hypothetical protein